MITFKLVLLLSLVLSTVLAMLQLACTQQPPAQLFDNWNDQIIHLLKEVMDTLPIPYTSTIDLYCSGQEAEIWFHTKATLDKDKNFITGVDPTVDDIKFHVNLTHFKLPSTGKYTCKISLQTYTFNDLLLFNFTGSDLDVTDFINSDVIGAIYSMFSGGSEINYSVDWSFTPLSNGSMSGTRLDSTSQRKESYDINVIYPILSKVIHYILHLPQSVMAELIKLGSEKKSIFRSTTPTQSNIKKKSTKISNKLVERGKIDNILKENKKTTNINYRDHESEESRMFKQWLNGKKKSALNAGAFKDHAKKFGTVNSIKGKKKSAYNTRSLKDPAGTFGAVNSINSIKGKKRTSGASFVSERHKKDNTSDERKSGQPKLIAAVIAALLFGFGIISLTVGIIFALLFYRKNVRGRKTLDNVEDGLNGISNPKMASRKARQGPCGIRLKAVRTLQRTSPQSSTNIPNLGNSILSTTTPCNDTLEESQVTTQRSLPLSFPPFISRHASEPELTCNTIESKRTQLTLSDSSPALLNSTARTLQTKSAPVSTNITVTRNHSSSSVINTRSKMLTRQSLPSHSAPVNLQTKPETITDINEVFEVPPAMSGSTLGKSIENNSLDLDVSTYSHLFKGKHLHTMRKISTTAQLIEEGASHDIKTTIIHVKPAQQ